VDLTAWRPGPGSEPGSGPGSDPMSGLGSGGEIGGTDPLGYRIGGTRRAGDIDYDLLIRLIVRLSLGEERGGREGAGAGGGEGGGGKGFRQGDKDVGEMLKQADGCILVFLPGVPEINKTIRLLESVWGEMRRPQGPRSVSLKILPL
jgi:hypothetical protein